MLILIKILLMFISNRPIDNISALVQILAWRRSGDRSLSDTMMLSNSIYSIYIGIIIMLYIYIIIGWFISSLLNNLDKTLQRRYYGCDGVSNHQPLPLFAQAFILTQIKKTPKLRVTGLCAGNSPVNSPHKRPVTRKMFQLDDVTMVLSYTYPCYRGLRDYSFCFREIYAMSP